VIPYRLTFNLVTYALSKYIRPAKYTVLVTRVYISLYSFHRSFCFVFIVVLFLPYKPNGILSYPQLEILYFMIDRPFCFTADVSFFLFSPPIV